MTGTLAPGDLLLGKYRVERVLGQGGMGAVVAARHLELDELVAIKVMLPRTHAAQESDGRFLREARAAAKIKSEHVVRVHDVGRNDDGTMFMVMEYLEGHDLKTHLAERHRLPVEEAITWVMQVCEALAEAHDLGIVHRDIKPANLFLSRKRKKAQSTIKVLDFGISKVLDAQPGDDLTRTGTMMGSPLYMSPEQMTHARNVDARTDIWSIGVVLYEFVSGVVPFPGETFAQVVHGVMSLDPPPLRLRVADVPDALDAVIQRCLQKDPARRYAHAEELHAALEKVLKGEPRGAANPNEALADTVQALAPAPTKEEFTTTEVGTDEPFADKPLALQDTVAVVEPQPMAPRMANHAAPVAETLTSASTHGPPAGPARRVRTNKALVGGVAALLLLGGAFWGLRQTDGTMPVQTSASPNAPEAPQKLATSFSEMPAPVAPEVVSSTNVLDAPSAAATSTSAPPRVPPSFVPTARASNVKPDANASGRVESESVVPSVKPSGSGRRRLGPL